MKEYLYEVFVNRKCIIKEKYEKYVLDNIQQHKKNRVKSWLYLLNLNFVYIGSKENSKNIEKGDVSTLNENKVQVCDLNSKNNINKKVNLEKAAIKANGTNVKNTNSKENNGIKSIIHDSFNRIAPQFLAIELLKFDLISFDIFDTLLLRPFRKPEDLFYLVGFKMNFPDFKRIRMEAEKHAREFNLLTKGNHEVTLDEIYDRVQFRTGISKSWGMAIELETEIEFCFANPYMKRLYEILKDNKKKIIACSDMYISKDKIKLILDKCGYADIDEIFVSCDYNCNKRNGGLYELIKGKYENVEKICHIGDNYQTDFINSKNYDIESLYYKNVHDIGNKFHPMEMSELIGSLYSGLVNSKLFNGINNDNVFYNYGYAFGGIYVIGFCNWISKYCKNNNINKVLFLSRDGEIYKEVIKKVCPEIPFEYVYWSRIAGIKYLAYKNRDEFLMRMVRHKVSGTFQITIESLFLSISLDFLLEDLFRYQIDKKQILCKENEKIIEKIFVENWDRIIKHYEEETDVLKNVIIHQIDNSKKIAVVDVGWTGNGPLGVKELIENKWELDCEVHCLLAASKSGNHVSNINQLQSEEIKSYMFSRNFNRNHYDYHTSSNQGITSVFFELFTQAMYPSYSGVTVDYKFCFDVPEVENYDIVNKIHKGIIDFSVDYYEKFGKYEHLLNISGYDAYIPFKHISQDVEFFKKHFGKFCYSRGVSMDYINQKNETINDIINKVNL